MNTSNFALDTRAHRSSQRITLSRSIFAAPVICAACICMIVYWQALDEYEFYKRMTITCEKEIERLSAHMHATKSSHSQPKSVYHILKQLLHLSSSDITIANASLTQEHIEFTLICGSLAQIKKITQYIKNIPEYPRIQVSHVQKTTQSRWRATYSTSSVDKKRSDFYHRSTDSNFTNL